MTANRAAGGWRGGRTVASVVSLLVITGLLLTLCAADVRAGQSEHHGDCAIEQATVATGAPATTPDAAGGASGESGVVLPQRWHPIVASPRIPPRARTATLQQPRAPPSLATS